MVSSVPNGVSRRLLTGMGSLLLLMSLALAAGCDGGSESAEGVSATGSVEGAKDYPYHAVATTGMVGDIVRNVAGDKAEVSAIMGPGVDPHLYTASRDDVARMMRSDIIFYSGLLLEGKMTDALVRVAGRKPVIAVTEVIDKQYLLEPEEYAGLYDPHVWMDPQAWSRCVDAAAERLAEFDPPNADLYRQNAEQYKEQLDRLHAYGETSLATIPEGSRVLVTSHDAFNYFGRAFNLNVEGIQGLSTQSEAGLARVNSLVDMLVNQDVKAVFAETSVPQKSIESLVNGARSRGHEVRIGGELFSDAMGSQGTYEGTYIGMIDHNITTVTRALGGQAPERGMQGKLSRGHE